MMKLFHFAPITLGPGSTIQPGNFGRMIGLYNFVASNSGAAVGAVGVREMVFETIRQASFPDKPSRLNATFGCPTIEDARIYGAANNAGGTQVLHEVELVDEAAPRHIGYLSRCNFADGVRVFPFFGDNAAHYWNGTGDGEQGRELITSSAFRVIKAM